MDRIEKWFIKNEFFANLSLALSILSFIAIFSMVNFSVQSIDTSGERTKANYLVSMIAEDIIGHKDTIHGESNDDENIVFNNEPYTSCVINEMIKKNIVFHGIELKDSSIVSLGTPTDVEKYIKNTNIL